MALFDYIGDEERRRTPEEEAILLNLDSQGVFDRHLGMPIQEPAPAPAATGSSNLSGPVTDYRERRQELEQVRGARPQRGDEAVEPSLWRKIAGYGIAAAQGGLRPDQPERAAAMGRAILDQPYTRAMEEYETDLATAEAGVAGAKEEYGFESQIRSDEQASALFELNKQLTEKRLAGMLTPAEERAQRQAAVDSLPPGSLPDRDAAVYVATGKIPTQRAQSGIGSKVTVRGPEGKPQIRQFRPDLDAPGGGVYDIPVGEGMPRGNESFIIQRAGLERWRGDQLRRLDVIRSDPMKLMKDEVYEKMKDDINRSYFNQLAIFGGAPAPGGAPADLPDIVGGFGGQSRGQSGGPMGAVPPPPPPPSTGAAAVPGAPAPVAGGPASVKNQGDVRMRAPDGREAWVPEGEVERAEQNDWVRVRDNTPAAPPKPLM